MPFAVAHRAPRDAGRCAALAAAGARAFELDVQLRGDRVVVSHYLPLGIPWTGLERDNWRLRRGPGRDRTLREALAVLPPDVDVLLDPKHHAGFAAADLVDALADEIADAGGPARFVVSTGGVALLESYRALGLRTWRSLGDRAAVQRALAGGPLPEEGVSVRHSLLDAETVRALHGCTGIIVAWTVNAPGRAQQLLALGVDAITTDRSGVLSLVRDAESRRTAGDG